MVEKKRNKNLSIDVFHNLLQELLTHRQGGITPANKNVLIDIYMNLALIEKQKPSELNHRRYKSFGGKPWT